MGILCANVSALLTVTLSLAIILCNLQRICFACLVFSIRRDVVCHWV